MWLKNKLSLSAASQCQAPVSWPLPWVWPSAHHHVEIEYDTVAKGYQHKDVRYNYDFKQLRYDMNYLNGEKKITTILNFTSLWLNDTLYVRASQPATLMRCKRLLLSTEWQSYNPQQLLFSCCYSAPPPTLYTLYSLLCSAPPSTLLLLLPPF